MKKISICLATYNEEKNLDRCLFSVKDFAWEIVIVDGSSQDKTRQLAKKYGARVFKVKNKPMFHKNKQLALDKAKGDWLLLLDADERLTKGLKKEIKSILSDDLSNVNGFWLARKNIIFKKWIKHTGWWPDYQLRLYKKGKVKFPCKSVHEQPEVKGETKKLSQPLVHYHYQTISQYLKRLDKYTDNDKRIFLKKRKKFSWNMALTMPADEFIKRFIVWQGYKDGLHGLILSLLQSFYQFIVFTKIWEEKGFEKKEIVSLDKKTVKILRKKFKELNWWRIQLILDKEKNILKKLFFKLKRKLKLLAS
jgi:glycosyltransferase involved in cell wall biosynthesis